MSKQFKEFKSLVGMLLNCLKESLNIYFEQRDYQSSEYIEDFLNLAGMVDDLT